MSAFRRNHAGIEISGFADFYHTINQGESPSEDFRLGQIEIDLAKEISEFVSVEAALAYDSENETFGCGAFIIDFHIFGSEGRHLKSIEGINHSGIIIGRFDVPFGSGRAVHSGVTAQADAHQI